MTSLIRWCDFSNNSKTNKQPLNDETHKQKTYLQTNKQKTKKKQANKRTQLIMILYCESFSKGRKSLHRRQGLGK